MKEEKIATRQSYGEALTELGKRNKNIVVLFPDSGEKYLSVTNSMFEK